jgi:TRAP transporter 4TM/12TM fusion protein
MDSKVEEIEQMKRESEVIKVTDQIIDAGNKINMSVDIMIAGISIFLGVFELYTGLFGQGEFYIQRGFHLMAILLVTPLFLYRASKNKCSKWTHAATFAAVVGIFIYFYAHYAHYRMRVWGVGFTKADILTGIILMVVSFFLAQRTVGWIMPVIGGLSVLYLFYGSYAPGIFHHPGYDLEFVVELSTWSEMGIFSTPLGVAASYLYLFILFGTLIDQMGTGNTFIELSKALAGRQKGGPAKIAVVSSGMMGSISGSPIANVLTTGAFTIPLMKKLGFEPDYAAAVTSVAATGGMILPPVMGVLAFAMVDYTGISYSRIITYAAIPAIMYYLCCYFAVHFPTKNTPPSGTIPQQQPYKLAESLCFMLR